MTLQSDRGREFEARAREQLSTPQARKTITHADISQRTLAEFQA